MKPHSDHRSEGRWLRGISRNTVVLGLVSFLNDLSSDMIHPHLLAVFLDSVLGTPAAAIGLIGGVAESVSSLLKPLAGWLSDALKRRKPYVLIGYWLASITRPLLALSSSTWHVLGLRFVDRVGKGSRTAPRDAMIVDSTSRAYRGKAFGLHRALDTAGAATGMLIVAILLHGAAGDLENTLRSIFVLASVPGIVLLALVVWGVRETGQAPGQAAPKLSGREFRRALNPQLLKWYVVVFVFWLGNSSNMFLILKARGLGMPVWQMPLLVFVMSAVHALLSTPAGALSDRVGRRSLIVAGWLVYALVYAGFAFARSGPAMLLLFGAYGVFYTLTEGAERALVADLSLAGARATALGMYHFVVGAAALPASVICGLLWQWDRLGEGGPQVALGFGAACALLAGVLFIILNPHPPAGSAPRSDPS